MTDIPLSIDVKRDDKLKCVFVKWRGVFRAKEASEFLCRLTNLGVCKDRYTFLHDARDLVFEGVAAGSEVAIAANTVPSTLSEFSAPKVAVAVKDDLSFGLMRMYAGLRANQASQRNVFKSISEAMRWLGLPPGTPYPF